MIKETQEGLWTASVIYIGWWWWGVGSVVSSWFSSPWSLVLFPAYIETFNHQSWPCQTLLHYSKDQIKCEVDVFFLLSVEIRGTIYEEMLLILKSSESLYIFSYYSAISCSLDCRTECICCFCLLVSCLFLHISRPSSFCLCHLKAFHCMFTTRYF